MTEKIEINEWTKFKLIDDFGIEIDGKMVLLKLGVNKFGGSIFRLPEWILEIDSKYTKLSAYNSQEVWVNRKPSLIWGITKDQERKVLLIESNIQTKYELQLQCLQ